MQRKRPVQRGRKRRVAGASAVRARDNRIIDKHPGGMPDSYVTTLEYSDIVKLTNASAPYGAYVYRGNSLYDPDYVIGGHQPLYFDQLMQIYTKYKVVSAQVRVVSVSPVASYLTITPATDPLVANTNTPQYAELPRSVVGAVGTGNVIPSRPLTARYNTQGVLGLTSAQLSDSDYSGTVSTNPSQLWYINITSVSTDITANASVSVHVRISYKAIFYDRVVMSPSFNLMPPAQLMPVRRRV